PLPTRRASDHTGIFTNDESTERIHCTGLFDRELNFCHRVDHYQYFREVRTTVSIGVCIAKCLLSCSCIGRIELVSPGGYTRPGIDTRSRSTTEIGRAHV